MTKVAILGCGPAGLMAAHAVALSGGEPVIISRKVKSELPGAQYLHRAIPFFCKEPDGVIHTVKTGTAEGYAYKVYGDRAHPTSWETAREEAPAWDLRRVYSELWATYSPFVEDRDIGILDIADIYNSFNLIISTIPAYLLCEHYGARAFMYGNEEHHFESEKMYVLDWAPPDVLDNTVLYSGDPGHQWYRASRIFGHASTEATSWCLDSSEVTYPTLEHDEKHEFIPLKSGLKVKGNDCDCRPGIVRAGRYGTWKKGYLTHHAFEDTLKAYEGRFQVV